MASVEAVASVTVGQPWMHRADAKESELFGASVDLKDGFHRFRNERLASWFCMNVEGLTAAELGVDCAYCDDSQAWVPVPDDSLVWPSYLGMPMGWSCAFWVCHETLGSIMDEISQQDEGSAQDKRPAPDLSRGRAVSAPYADKANVLGFDSIRVQEKLNDIVKELDKRRLRWHERVDADGLFETLGIEAHGRHGRVRHKPRRMWRLYRGIEFLLRSPTVPGWQVRVDIGHIVTVCQLMRPALGCLRLLYDFVSGAPVGEWRVLPAACRAELCVVKGLLLTAEVDLRAAPADIAFMSDASLKGSALYETLADEKEVREMTPWRERVSSRDWWRRTQTATSGGPLPAQGRSGASPISSS